MRAPPATRAAARIQGPILEALAPAPPDTRLFVEAMIRLAPDTPTVAESGFPGFEAITWHGMMMPAGVPAPIVQTLNAQVVRILGQPEFRAWLLTQGADATPSTPEAFAEFMKAELALYARLVKQSGMKAD